MIRYALVCESGHDFESWFANSTAFDQQAKRALVNCPVCGSAKVEKAMMAPNVASAPARAEAAAAQPPAPTLPSPASAGGIGKGLPPMPPKNPVAMVSPPERELRQKLKELRDHITKNASYVGPRFPEEARKIHYGETEHRSIYGEASPEEARELYDEGIEFHPLPILPDDKN
jgi:hypothetical protein